MTTLFDLNDPDILCCLPEDAFLVAYRGSVAHNMYVPDTDPNSIDDIDLMGFVIAPAECYLGLSQWGSHGTKEIKQGRYDCIYYEIRKAFELLLKGNPNIMSVLWTLPMHHIVRSKTGALLLENRGLFVGSHVYHPFAGYASAQLQKMETRDAAELRDYISVTNELKKRGAHPNHKGEQMPYPDTYDTASGEARNAALTSTEKLQARLTHYQKKGENLGYLGDKRKQLVLQHGYDSKNAAHCIRLLRMCKEFLETGAMTVYRTTDAEELLSIKRGAWKLDDVKALAEQLFEEIKQARDRSALPLNPNKEQAEELLMDVLSEHIFIHHLE